MENTESRSPVKYRAKEKSLIGNDIVEAGQEVMYAGLPSDNLEPLCAEGRARAAEFEASNKKRVDNLVEKNKESAVGDPEQFLASFTKMLAEQKAEADAKFATLVEQNNQLLQLLLEQRTAPAPAAAEPAPAPAPAAAVQEEKPPAAATDDGEDKQPAKRTKG